jgi:hypothetical protein
MTVERHRANILEKLDRVELTRNAIRRGLVQADHRTVPLTTCADWGPG